MDLSISIVHYRQEQELSRFLESIFRFPPSCSFEVIVVDNSAYSGKEMLGGVIMRQLISAYQADRRVRFIVSDMNRGMGKAHNLVADIAAGEFLAFCNSDLIVQQGSFDRLVSYLQAHPQVGLAGPKLCSPNGTVQDSCRRFPRCFDPLLKRLSFRSGHYLMKDRDMSLCGSVDWVVGAVMMMRKDLFRQLGGFDERFFLFFEDTDLCKRIRKCGLQVHYVSDSIFSHEEDRLSDRGSFVSNLFKKSFWIHVKSALRYFWKWQRLRRSIR